MNSLLDESIKLNKTTLNALRAVIMTEDLDRVKAHNLFCELEGLNRRVERLAMRGAA